MTSPANSPTGEPLERPTRVRWHSAPWWAGVSGVVRCCSAAPVSPARSSPIRPSTQNGPPSRGGSTPEAAKTARTVDATFGLPNARYIDVDTGQIIVSETQTPGDAMDYQLEPGTITPRGRAMLAQQAGDTNCSNTQVENSQLRQFAESPFCGTSGELPPGTPKYFKLEIVRFQAGNCTIRVTYFP